MSIATSSENPTQAVVDILSGYTGWPQSEPDTFRVEQVTPRSQMQGSSSLAIYAWTSSPIDQTDFDAEFSESEEDTTVQVLVKGLDETETVETATVAKQLLEEYARDNKDLTEFHEIKPSQVRDLRDENNKRSTEPYIQGIQVTVERLRTPGLD